MVIQTLLPSSLLVDGHKYLSKQVRAQWLVLVSHDQQLELLEELPLQGLAHIVPPHLGGGHVFDLQVLLGYLISQKEVSNVESSRSLAGALLAIGFE